MAKSYEEHMRRWNIDMQDKDVFEKLKAAIIRILSLNLEGGLWYFDKRFCKNANIKHIYVDEFKKELSFGYAEILLEKSKDKRNFFYYLEIILDTLKEVAEIESQPKKINEYGEEVVEEDEEDLNEEPEEFDFDFTDKEPYSKIYSKIVIELKDFLSKFPSGVSFVDSNGEITFYPVGAKLLDKKLVNDVLEWLIEYKSAYNNFKTALEGYEEKSNPRNITDNLRASLEFFLKEYLGNNASLEKQSEFLLPFLKKENVSLETRNMFFTLLKYYSDYQNEHAKHNDKVNERDIEFIIYLTGTFIRFLITLKNKKI